MLSSPVIHVRELCKTFIVHEREAGVLAALESLVRAWPGLRGLGDHVVLEGHRR